MDDITNCPPTVKKPMLNSNSYFTAMLLLGLCLPWHDDWQVLAVVWSQPWPLPDHFPLDTANSPSCLSLKGWWGWWGPTEQATLCQTPPNLGPPQTKCPRFLSFETRLWRTLAWFHQRTCTNPEAGSTVNQKHCIFSCNSWIQWTRKRFKLKFTKI